MIPIAAAAFFICLAYSAANSEILELSSASDAGFDFSVLFEFVFPDFESLVFVLFGLDLVSASGSFAKQTAPQKNITRAAVAACFSIERFMLVSVLCLGSA